MALYIEGLSTCRICEKVIENAEVLFSVPAIWIVNESDPLFPFSDSVLHKDCIINHPLGDKLMALIDDWSANTGPGKRKCSVSQKEVMDPDDYFQIGYLTYDKNNPLSQYNFMHFHKSLLMEWEDREKFLELLVSAQVLGKLKGRSLDWLIDVMENQKK